MGLEWDIQLHPPPSPQLSFDIYWFNKPGIMLGAEVYSSKLNSCAP